MVSSREANRLNSQRLQIENYLETYYERQETHNPVPESEMFNDVAICDFLNTRQAHYAAGKNFKMEFFYMGLIEVGNRAVRRDMVFLMASSEALEDKSLCEMELELYDVIMAAVGSAESEDVICLTSPGVSSESVKGGTSESSRKRRDVSLPDRLPPGGDVQVIESETQEVPTASSMRQRIIDFFEDYTDEATEDHTDWADSPEVVIREFIENRVSYYKALGDQSMHQFWVLVLEVCDQSIPLYEAVDLLMEVRQRWRCEEKKKVLDRRFYRSIMEFTQPIRFDDTSDDDDEQISKQRLPERVIEESEESDLSISSFESEEEDEDME